MFCHLLFVAVFLWLFTSINTVVDSSNSGGNSHKNVKIKLLKKLFYVKIENETTRESRLGTAENIYCKGVSKRNNSKLRRSLSILMVKKSSFIAPQIHEGEDSLEDSKNSLSNNTFCNVSVRSHRRYYGIDFVKSTQDIDGKIFKLNVRKRVIDEISNSYEDQPEDSPTFVKSNDKAAKSTRKRRSKTFDDSLLPELTTEASGFVTVKLSQPVSMKEFEAKKPRYFPKLTLRNKGIRIRRDTEQPRCSKKLSCENRCTIRESFQGQKEDKVNHCYCDEFCETFLDCCYDYKEQCKINITERNFLRKKSANIQSSKQFSYAKGQNLQCVSLPGNKKIGTGSI